MCMSIEFLLQLRSHSGSYTKAPIKAASDSLKKRSLGDVNPTPWVFMTGNSFGWICYSFVTKDYFVLVANAPGFVISLWLNSVAIKLEPMNEFEHHRDGSKPNYVPLEREIDQSILHDSPLSHPVEVTSEEKPNMTPNMGKVSMIGFHEKKFISIVAVWFAIMWYAAFPAHRTLDDMKAIIGIGVNCNLIFFFGSPLSTMFSVIRSKDSSSIDFRTMIMNTFCSAFWTLYGSYKSDILIALPNGIGILFGLCQALLYCIFPRAADAAEALISESMTDASSIDSSLEDDVERSDKKGE